ncbi:MAG: hypothetical protein L0Z62_50295 [Gemmataceae bacterium]|nr:hypothetical protein [Gemmataceae bacterium]
MTRIVVNDIVSNVLREIPNSVEVCDQSGRVLGRFTPFLDPALYEGLEPQISDEERQRRRESRSGRTYTTAEVLAHLEKLGCSR